MQFAADSLTKVYTTGPNPVYFKHIGEYYNHTSHVQPSNGVATGLAATNTSAGDRSNKRVLILTRETGFAEVAELQFNYSSGPALVGNRHDLLEEWRLKLAIPARNPAEPAAGMLDLPTE
jgi:hypothetical protein